jgi:hypothetical protein
MLRRASVSLCHRSAVARRLLGGYMAATWRSRRSRAGGWTVATTVLDPVSDAVPTFSSCWPIDDLSSCGCVKRSPVQNGTDGMRRPRTRTQNRMLICSVTDDCHDVINEVDRQMAGGFRPVT